MKLTGFLSRHIKHSGCSYRGNNVLVKNDDDGNLSQACLALCECRDAAESLDDAGCGGNIGGGDRVVEVVFESDDGEITLPLDSSDAQAAIASLPHGRIDPTTVAKCAGNRCWDGNNHVYPSIDGLLPYVGLNLSCPGSPAPCGSPGHWAAGDWIQVRRRRRARVGFHGQDVDDETASEIVEAAALEGVHLDEDEVQDIIDAQATQT